jgi:hemerythrin-like domain-containing protein
LRHEHEAILKMLEAAEDVARQLECGERVAKSVLDDLLEFFRLFADRCHHGKEEELLFPVLERKGIPRYGGPLGVMLEEHERGRALISEMLEGTQAYASGAEDAGRRWARAARDYVALLGAHINKENNVLFVMAERVLTSEEQHELARAFEKLEVEKMGAGTHERLHAKADKFLPGLGRR